MNLTFSIIIPHHNIPGLLVRCLQSIPQREDTEIIVVDDNSRDADTYLEQFPELNRPDLVLIRTTVRRGAGYARNVGLDLAKGKWLLFADSDDFFVKDFSDILDSYKDAVEDILYFRNLSVLSDDITSPSHRDDWINQLIINYIKTHNQEALRCNHCVPWGKMIRRAFVRERNFRFDEVMYSNDVMFGLKTGCQAKQIAVIDRPLYVLTERKGSLTSQFATKPDELKTRAEVCFRAQSYVNSLGDPYPSLFKCMSVSDYYSRMFHQDKSLFILFFPNLLHYYPSYFKALKQIRLRETNRIDKIKLYMYSGWLILRQSFI